MLGWLGRGSWGSPGRWGSGPGGIGWEEYDFQEFSRGWGSVPRSNLLESWCPAVCPAGQGGRPVSLTQLPWLRSSSYPGLFLYLHLCLTSASKVTSCPCWCHSSLAQISRLPEVWVCPNLLWKPGLVPAPPWELSFPSVTEGLELIKDFQGLCQVGLGIV